jgi:hypothetical protein
MGQNQKPLSRLCGIGPRPRKLCGCTPERNNNMKANKSNLKIACQHPPKSYNMKIIAANEKSGLNLYLSNSGGSKYYLVTHHRTGLLWSLLKDGMYIEELRRLRPNGDRRTQKIYKSVRHILKVIDSFLQYELSA